MRSMVEGLTDSVSPSTAFQAVPLPTSYARREDKIRSAPIRSGKYFVALNR